MHPQSSAWALPRRAGRLARTVARGMLATLFLGLLVLSWPAWAGLLDRAALERHVHERLGLDYTLGERHAALPVWPVFSRHGASPRLHAYVFESQDIEPVRGYSGKPIDLLITMTPTGAFLDVTLIHHDEPIFQSESATRELYDFAAQYDGLSIDHDIQFFSARTVPSRTETTARLHGVLRGTVSASAIDRSILSAAVRVAEAGLDDPDAKARPAAPGGRVKRLGWTALQEAGLIHPIERTNESVEKSFRGTSGARRDAAGIFKPDGLALQAWGMPVSLPQVGRNVLDADGWLQVHGQAEDGRTLFLFLDDSRYAFTDARAGEPRLRTIPTLRQDGVEIALERLEYGHKVRLTGRGSGVPETAVPRLFTTVKDSGFDVARPFSLGLRIIRGEGEGVAVALDEPFEIPEIERWLPKIERPPWLDIWAQKQAHLAILAGGLALLSLGLGSQRWLAYPVRRLTWLRTAWLVFTLVFIGWWAQGQLTIVNLTSSLEAALQGQSIDFLLADPMAVTLWAFVGVTLFVWGRGTFCGWLCPFGALQELVSTVAGWLGWPRRQLHSRLDGDLKLIKYLVLLAILIAVAVGSPVAPWLIEIEPFKTAISMTFERAWPYVLWALLCIGLTLIVYRGFCRYLCPLGAALALLGRVRLLNWIPRREACGTPCQTCRFRCSYQAISPRGRIDYTECFQCLDCVSIHEDDRRCMPLILEARETRRRVVPIAATEQREAA